MFHVPLPKFSWFLDILINNITLENLHPGFLFVLQVLKYTFDSLIITNMKKRRRNNNENKYLSFSSNYE